MQAVILAAGRGARMEEFTTAIPKAMVTLLGRPLLDYKFEVMPIEIDEVIVVVGYFGDVIINRYGGEYGGKRITYVQQNVLDGTAGALWVAKDLLRNRFLVMMGDDLYPPTDVQKCVDVNEGWAVLVQQEVGGMHRAGSVELDEKANVSRIVEGEAGEGGGLACTNLFNLDMRIFSQPLIPKQAGSLEFGLPQTAIAAAQALDIPLRPLFTTDWVQINAPGDLAKATEILSKMGR